MCFLEQPLTLFPNAVLPRGELRGQENVCPPPEDDSVSESSEENKAE